LGYLSHDKTSFLFPEEKIKESEESMLFMDKKMKIIVRCLETLILMVVLIGFLVIFSTASCLTWFGKTGAANKALNDTSLYIATALAGFMMAFFANRMGVDIEAISINIARDNTDEEKKFKKHCYNDKNQSLLYDRFYDNKGYLHTKQVIGSLYLVVFFVVALVSIITWVVSKATPDVIKNVACISVSLFIGIAKNVLDTV
jgi:hypothetical protein